MSDAVSPQHGFPMARRGYDPDQVERAMVELTEGRDQAWERLSGLGNRMRALEQQLIDAAKAAEEAEPPSFAHLSERAGRLLVITEEEASAIRAEAEDWVDALDAEARADGQQSRAEGDDQAVRLRAAADEGHRRELERARSRAEAERADADREARTLRDEAAGYAGGVRDRAQEIAETTRTRLAALQHRADQELAGTEAAAVAQEEQLTSGAEHKQGEAERHRKAMQAMAEEIEAEAATRVERVLEAGRREAERIGAAAERDRAAFAERRDELQAHLDHIRTTLTALTGAADAPAAEVPADPDGSEGATAEVPLPVTDVPAEAAVAAEAETAVLDAVTVETAELETTMVQPAGVDAGDET